MKPSKLQEPTFKDKCERIAAKRRGTILKLRAQT